MSGWVIIRQQPGTAVFGGIAVSAASSLGKPSSGWVIIRQQPGTAVFGGVAAFSNVPAPPARTVIADDGDAPWHIRSRRRRT